MAQFKFIGIAMAAYAPPVRFFAEQLKSIQDQTYKSWICIVTFDSPMKEVLEHPLIEPFTREPRFRFHENPRRLGFVKNFERGIQLALDEKVDAIACSDQDDLWYPGKLQETLEALNVAGPGSLVHCDRHVLYENGELAPDTMWVIEHKQAHNAGSQHTIVRNLVAGAAMLFDATLAERYPVIPAGLDFHDWWYALVAGRYGGVHAIHKSLYAYRQHGANIVGVVPFHGAFAPGKKRASAVLQECMASWVTSNRIALAAASAGLPLTLKERILFVNYWDMGSGLLAMSLRYWRKDPLLARATLSRAIGKPLYFFAQKVLRRNDRLPA